MDSRARRTPQPKRARRSSRRRLSTRLVRYRYRTRASWYSIVEAVCGIVCLWNLSEGIHHNMVGAMRLWLGKHRLVVTYSQRTLAADQGRVSHAYPSDVCNGVERPGHTLERHTEIPGPGLLLCDRGGGNQRYEERSAHDVAPQILIQLAKVGTAGSPMNPIRLRGRPGRRVFLTSVGERTDRA